MKFRKDCKLFRTFSYRILIQIFYIRTLVLYFEFSISSIDETDVYEQFFEIKSANDMTKRAMKFKFKFDTNLN